MMRLVLTKSKLIYFWYRANNSFQDNAAVLTEGIEQANHYLTEYDDQADNEKQNLFFNTKNIILINNNIKNNITSISTANSTNKIHSRSSKTISTLNSNNKNHTESSSFVSRKFDNIDIKNVWKL